MAIAHVRTAAMTTLFGGGVSGVATFSGTTAAGNLIAVGVIRTGSTISSIVDSAGNTYIPVGAGELTGGFAIGRIYYAKNVTGGTNIAVTVTLASGEFGHVFAHEVSGADTTSPLDQESQNAQSGVGTGTDAVTSGTDTTTTNGQYIFGCMADESFGGPTQTKGTGFTDGANSVDDNGFVGSSEYQIQASAGSIAATFTHSASNDTIALMATFKAAAAAGRTTKNTRAFPLGMAIGMNWVGPGECS